MGPRPGPLEPSLNPVTLPGRPGPTFTGPVTLREVPSPSYQAAGDPAQSPRDAGVDTVMSDVATLPPVADSMPTDAAKTLQP